MKYDDDLVDQILNNERSAAEQAKIAGVVFFVLAGITIAVILILS